MRSSDATTEEDFVFPYSPREINIGKLSDEMVQIARPGTTPIVAFKSHNLMTIDFTALIAHPGDGLIQSVDPQIFALRRMASSSDKVFQLLNYDIFTRTPYIYRNMSEERFSGLFFSITEMSIDVTRRNKENSISSANVKISLVENRNPNINVALIPPLKFSRQNPSCKDPAFAKKFPNKCKTTKTSKTTDSATNEFDTSAGQGQNKFKGKTGLLCPQANGTNKFIMPGKPGYCG
jgi:hypothetical protein